MKNAFAILPGGSNLERYIPEVVRWVHRAGNPYYDWIFGNAEKALRILPVWLKRPSSEISITRLTLLLDRDCTVGGYIALGGADLVRCRKADTLALLKETESGGRSELLARMAAVRNLFPPVDTDEFYLSKMGVVTHLQGKGLGRRIVREYLAAGRAAGYWRFRLDVWAENKPARHLYESLGFRVVQESSSIETGLKYLSMIREDGER